MSLDLYIISKTPVQHRGTGVYIRENGETKELITKQEVLQHFPDVDPNSINETFYEDDEYFHLNLTHNLTKMADNCAITGNCLSIENSNNISIYDLLWHPLDNLGVEVPSNEYLEDVEKAYMNLASNPGCFKKYNPSNGWGTYEQLVEGTKKYLDALKSISDNFDDYKIVAST